MSSAPRSIAKGPHRRPAWLSGRVLTAVVVAVLAVVLIVENTAEISIRLIVPIVRMPMWSAFVILYLGGMLTGWLACRRR